MNLQTRPKPVIDPRSYVVVIDDDVGFRDSVGRLLRAVGLQANSYGSIAEFLESKRPDGPTCMVLDIRMPGQSGLDFQRELGAAGIRIPIIFITGYGDIPMTVQAMKAGAVEFLTKPFRDQDLLDAINVGLADDRAHREEEDAAIALRARFKILTPRERAVLFQVWKGRLNKQIAGDMGITESTVKVHRSNLMRKVKLSSVAELCRMVDRLKLLNDIADEEPF